MLESSLKRFHFFYRERSTLMLMESEREPIFDAVHEYVTEKHADLEAIEKVRDMARSSMRGLKPFQIWPKRVSAQTAHSPLSNLTSENSQASAS